MVAEEVHQRIKKVKMSKSQVKLLKDTDYSPSGKSPIAENIEQMQTSLTSVEMYGLQAAE